MQCQASIHLQITLLDYTSLTLDPLLVAQVREERAGVLALDVGDDLEHGGVDFSVPSHNDKEIKFAQLDQDHSRMASISHRERMSHAMTAGTSSFPMTLSSPTSFTISPLTIRYVYDWETEVRSRQSDIKISL